MLTYGFGVMLNEPLRVKQTTVMSFLEHPLLRDRELRSTIANIVHLQVVWENGSLRPTGCGAERQTGVLASSQSLVYNKTIASKDIKEIPAQDIASDEPPEEVVPLPAVCDCCSGMAVPPLVVDGRVEVNGMVVVALTTKPDRAKLIVSPSTTRAGPPTEMVWPKMEKALSPADAVNVWPPTSNSMLMPVAPIPLVDVATTEAIEPDAVLD
ncbi:hypothetical protein KCU99_g343, partial [Aureobasidium melanogenum]